MNVSACEEWIAVAVVKPFMWERNL